MAAQAVVWGRRRLGLGTRHAGLELAHGEVLPGLGRYHRVLDVLEVVGLDRPVRSRAGGDALYSRVWSVPVVAFWFRIAFPLLLTHAHELYFYFTLL